MRSPVRIDPARLLLLGWRVAGRTPEVVVRAAMHVAADVAWLRRGAGVRRLEANLARVRPEADGPALRRLSRQGMRTYLRYYAEAFTLGGVRPEQIDARVRVEGEDGIRAALSEGRGVVAALAHQGNWDLAGAWAGRNLAPVTTVAERLEPPEVFDAFVALREGVGMRILALDKGGSVFRELVRAVRTDAAFVPLLADRDLSASGVEVTLFDERARVAAGPAALSLATGAPLVPVSIQHERLRGARRRAAGARWGIVVRFHPPVRLPDATPDDERVAVLTQAWVDVVAADIAAEPVHWHMLQRVFVADLDPSRLPAAQAAR